MKKRVIGIILLLLVSVIGIFYYKNQSNSQHDEKALFWVLSDTHLLEKSLFDTGKEFERIKLTAAGKDLEYQEESLSALVDSAIKEKPTGIIITGDLTLNGEKRSAEKLAEILKPLEDHDIAYYVIPGNHDINDGWARAFRGDKAYNTEQISEKDFETIFSPSYKNATDKDKNSLSYVVNVNDHFQFLMLDTNIYGKLNGTTVPQTKGRLKTETLVWIEKQLAKGKDNDKQTIVFMHHNLLKHNEFIYEGYVLENAEELHHLLNKYQVPLVFSGHSHTQSIKKSESGNITEVISASYAITEQLYGEVCFTPSQISYEKKRIDVDTWAQDNQLKDPNLLEYRDYTKQLFVEDGQRMAYGQLIENGLYDEEKLDEIAYFVGETNWRYFTGNDNLTNEEVEALKNEQGYQLLKDEDPFLGRYMDSILQSDGVSNDHFTIKMK